MLRRHGTALRLSLMAADAASAELLVLVVSYLRFGSDWPGAWAAAGVEPVFLAAGYAAALVATLWLLGLYRLRVHWSRRREWLDIVRGVLLLAVLTLAILFAAKLPNISRVFLGELFVAQAVVTLVSRLLVRRLYVAVRTSGFNASFILIVGDGVEAQSFAALLASHSHLGLKVAGFIRSPAPDAPAPGAEAQAQSGLVTEAPSMVAVGQPAGRSGGLPGRPRTLGDLNDLPSILHGLVVDEVAVCLSPSSFAFLEPIARLCEDEGKIVRIPLTVPGLRIAGGTVDKLDGVEIQSLVRGPDQAIATLLKRGLDVAGAMIGLILLAPLLAIAGMAVVAQDGWPILYFQERVGRNGRPFRLVKLRSMVKDAEGQRHELEARNEIQGHAFKVTNDPRVTRVGRVLRRTSVDELPQLWNVLWGEMSLVGPRPPLPAEVAKYDIWHRRRLMMKPGITGLWQVSARSEANFDQWVRLDIDYIDRWSLGLDIKIMLRTLPALLQGR